MPTSNIFLETIALVVQYQKYDNSHSTILAGQRHGIGQ